MNLAGAGETIAPQRDQPPPQRAGPHDGFVMRMLRATAMLVALRRNRFSATRAVARLKVGDLEIDALHRQVRQGSREIKLSPGQHILLYTLAARAGEVVSYREIADALGQIDLEIRNNTLARHVSALRGKLHDDPVRPRYIETVSRIGYRFLPMP